MNRVHIIRERRIGESKTLCGLVGWPEGLTDTASEYSTVNGDRFEVAVSGTKATCKRCLRSADASSTTETKP